MICASLRELRAFFGWQRMRCCKFAARWRPDLKLVHLLLLRRCPGTCYFGRRVEKWKRPAMLLCWKKFAECWTQLKSTTSDTERVSCWYEVFRMAVLSPGDSLA